MERPVAEVQEDASRRHDELLLELARTREELAAANNALLRAEELRNEAAAREAALERELQHRVRNMLAIIRSVFTRTIETAETLQSAADHFTGRLDTLGRYQSLLARRPDGVVDLEMLVWDELLTLGFDGSSRVAVRGSTVLLPLKVAELVGIAVHELATNAVKFGALSVHDGRLAVSWEISPETMGLSLKWVETGVAVVASAPLRTGFGREYIEAALPYELNAKTSFELRPGGLLCQIDVSREALAS
jgi:two-component sensor histidine kinase